VASPAVYHHRARVGALSRDRDANDPELIAERQALTTERLADAIRKAVDAAPPLTPEQRDRLALLLRGSAA